MPELGHEESCSLSRPLRGGSESYRPLSPEADITFTGGIDKDL